jgi:hypothetical protein
MSRLRNEKTQAAESERDSLLREIDALLKKPNELIRDMALPPDLIPAFATGRAELLALAQPRAMDAQEVKKLYTLIQTLLETNCALQRHATKVADMTGNLHTQFQGLLSGVLKAQAFANFAAAQDADEE